MTASDPKANIVFEWELDYSEPIKNCTGDKLSMDRKGYCGDPGAVTTYGSVCIKVAVSDNGKHEKLHFDEDTDTDLAPVRTACTGMLHCISLLVCIVM